MTFGCSHFLMWITVKFRSDFPGKTSVSLNRLDLVLHPQVPHSDIYRDHCLRIVNATYLRLELR